MATAPYGSWPSPVSVEQLTSASIGLAAPRIDGDHLYWLSSRPDQGGRASVWRRLLAGGEHEELTPTPTYVRSRVHEYGGGEYDVREGVLVYSELTDGRVYAQTAGTTRALTPESPTLRFGDLRVHPSRDLVLAVREDHTGDGEPTNTIVALSLTGESAGTVLCSGADFYSTPELSAAGRLAWTEWQHPNMPWDATSIRVGQLDGFELTDVQEVAGGPEESAVQPRWLGSDLVFVSDRSNWWNLYRWNGADTRALAPAEAEFCSPQWVLGQQPYAVVDDRHLLSVVIRDGASSLALVDLATGQWTDITDPEVGTDGVAVGAGYAAAVLTRPDRPAALSLADLGPPTWTDVLASSAVGLDPRSVSVAEPVTWASEQGPVHGWFYAPTNVEFSAPAGTLPPLVTLSHGGPTAEADPGFRLAYQFWTTRGYAVLDVNYGGSTGFGRDYRNRLRGQWGIVDVADCAAGASVLGERGLADPNRLVIKGGSAGGYTTLRALTATTVFAAGISQYGIGDLETLARDTHKFEARYLDRLVGPYPADAAVYRDRSPIHHLDQLATPILLLQGLEDFVVPPSQAEEMAAAARTLGLPVALLLFEGEGHGFRRAETIQASLRAQLAFLGRVLGFRPADDLPAIVIDNLD